MQTRKPSNRIPSAAVLLACGTLSAFAAEPSLSIDTKLNGAYIIMGLAVRVLGAPACGDNPQQPFSSCAELQAISK